jgi:hypothetical protein
LKKPADGDNIQINLAEMGWNGEEWIIVAYERNKWRAVVKSNEISGSAPTD